MAVQIHQTSYNTYGRHLYPKRQTLHSPYTFDQIMQSLGIKLQCSSYRKAIWTFEHSSNQHSYAYSLTCKTFA